MTNMTKKRWVVAIVTALFVAALIILYYLGLLGNAAVAEPTPARAWFSGPRGQDCWLCKIGKFVYLFTS
jgi:hypothetical protein